MITHHTAKYILQQQHQEQMKEKPEENKRKQTLNKQAQTHKTKKSNKIRAAAISNGQRTTQQRPHITEYALVTRTQWNAALHSEVFRDIISI